MAYTLNQFSQTEITTHDVCPRKWYWQYSRCIKPLGGWNWDLEVGSAFHKFLENYNLHGFPPIAPAFLPTIEEEVVRTPDFESKLSFWQTFFPAWCEEYHKFQSRYSLPATKCAERLVQKEYHGLTFVGKIDQELTDNCPHIVDTKTMTNMKVYGNSLHITFQFLFYFWISGYTSGKFTVNKVKKPAQKQGKKEADWEFADRCVQEMRADPGAYFARETADFTEEEMKIFEAKVLNPKIVKLHSLAGLLPTMPFLTEDMHMHSCYSYNKPCPFMPLCFEDEALAEIYYKPKTSKHEELENETE